MSVLNKSNHPVLIKRVNLETWTLRAEIEAKLATLIETNDEAQIELTKEFYSNLETINPPETLSKAKLGLAPEEEQAPDKKDSTEDEDEAKEVDTEETANKAEFVRVYPPSDERNKGFLFLAELNMDGILFFSKQTYKPGQNIVIEFLVTKPFTLIIEIMKSVPISNRSKIISDSRPEHRILGEFKFYFSGERTNLRNFLKSVEPDLPPPPKKLMQSMKSEEEDEDDSIDLDDLGF